MSNLNLQLLAAVKNNNLNINQLNLKLNNKTKSIIRLLNEIKSNQIKLESIMVGEYDNGISMKQNGDKLEVKIRCVSIWEGNRILYTLYDTYGTIYKTDHKSAENVKYDAGTSEMSFKLEINVCIVNDIKYTPTTFSFVIDTKGETKTYTKKDFNISF